MGRRAALISSRGSTVSCSVVSILRFGMATMVRMESQLPFRLLSSRHRIIEIDEVSNGDAAFAIGNLSHPFRYLSVPGYAYSPADVIPSSLFVAHVFGMWNGAKVN